MEQDWINKITDYIPWIYISIQVFISLIVSIMGAKFIRNEFKRQKNKIKQQQDMELQILMQQHGQTKNGSKEKLQDNNSNTAGDQTQKEEESQENKDEYNMVSHHAEEKKEGQKRRSLTKKNNLRNLKC